MFAKQINGILAACGQLKSDSDRLSKKDREALAG